MPKHKGGPKWKPSRINAYDPVKYLFYNHGECGSKALNPLSPFFEVGIRDYLRNKPRTTSPVIKKIAADLEKDGIAVFSIDDIAGGSSLFLEMSAELSEEIDSQRDEIRAWSENLTDSKKKPYLFKIEAQPSLSRPCWKTALHPEILALVNGYMHAHSTIQDMQYWINAARPGAEPEASQLWHRDGDGTCIKLFVYLSDVTDRSGPFWYASGTHRGERRRTHGESKRLTDDQMNQLFDGSVQIRSIVGRPGTAILANTCGYHKGGFVEEGKRHVLQIAYYCPWIDRSDYGLLLPAAIPASFQPAQIAAIARAR